VCEEFETLSGVEKLDVSASLVTFNSVADLYSADSIVSTFSSLNPSNSCFFGVVANELPRRFSLPKRSRGCTMWLPAKPQKRTGWTT